MSNLKRCPFCSGEAKIEWEDWKDISPTSGIYRLSVNHKPECFFVQMNGLNAKSEMISSNKERLAEAWNNRKPMQNIMKRLEENLQKFEEKRKMAESEADKLRFFNFEMALRKAVSIVREEGGIDGSNL